MKKNMSNLDRMIRVLVALILSLLYFTSVITGSLGLVLMVFSGVFVMTSFVSFCPLYFPFGKNTCKN